MAPIWGVEKNPTMTIALAQANDNKHMIILKDMMNFWILKLKPDYTFALVAVALPHVVLQRVLTPSRPIMANIAKPANTIKPTW